MRSYLQIIMLVYCGKSEINVFLNLQTVNYSKYQLKNKQHQQGQNSYNYANVCCELQPVLWFLMIAFNSSKQGWQCGAFLWFCIPFSVSQHSSIKYFSLGWGLNSYIYKLVFLLFSNIEYVNFRGKVLVSFCVLSSGGGYQVCWLYI